MKPKQTHVVIKLDTSKFEQAMRGLANSVRRAARSLSRVGMTPGDRHIDRICKEILAGAPGRPAEIRLLAASDFAQVLDRKWKP